MASPERIFPYRGRTPDGPVVPHKAGLGPVTKVLGGRGGRFGGGRGSLSPERFPLPPPIFQSTPIKINYMTSRKRCWRAVSFTRASVSSATRARSRSTISAGARLTKPSLASFWLRPPSSLSILPSSFSRRASSAAKSTAPDRCTMTSQPCATWLAEALGASPSASMMSSPRRASVRMTSRFASRTSFWWASDGRSSTVSL